MASNPLFVSEEQEMIGSSTTLDWFRNHRIAAYTLKAADEGIMQAWSQKVLEVLDQWPKDRPYLALHDLSAPGCAVFYMVYADYRILNVGISPENRERAEAILRNMDHPARVAVHLSMSLSGRITQHSAELTQDENPPVVDYRTFFSREKALEWLAEGIK